MEDEPPRREFAAHSNDAFFKEVFSDRERARAFFQEHLPASITEGLDWMSLRVLPGSFVKASLQQVHSDLLFSVKMCGREALLYLLFEHQSTVDRAMPLRLLSYVCEVLNRHHEEHGLPLPPVVPFLFHQGPDSWDVSCCFEDLFDLPEDLREHVLPMLPRFRHALLDLTQFDPAAEEDDQQLRVILQLMKLARERRLLEFFRWLAETVAEQVPDRLLGRLLLYALHADSDLDPEQIYDTLSTNPHLEKQAMSVAEKLRAEGRMEGRMEGLSAGLWIGKILALEEVLGFPPSSREGLDSMSVAALEERYRQLHDDFEKGSKVN